MSYSASQSCLLFDDPEGAAGTLVAPTPTASPYWSSTPAVSYNSFTTPTDAQVTPTFSNLGAASPSQTFTCNPNITITPTTIPDSTYIVKATALTFSFIDFKVPTACTGAVFTYTATLSSGSALPSFITFTASTRTFSISTTSNANVGTYVIKVAGALQTTTLSGFTTFTLTVVSSCTVATVTASSLSTQNYYVANTALAYSMPTFSTNDSSCTITYTMTLANSNPIDTSLITLTASTPSISVQTNSLSYVAAYSLKLIGTISGFTNTASATFTLNVLNICSLTTLTPTAITTYSYDISETTTDNIATLAWTQSQVSCLTGITYFVQTAGGSAAPSIVSISGSQLQVYTIDSAKVGTYSLQIVGSVGAFTSRTVAFTLIVTNNCASTTLTTTSVSNQNYVVGATALIFAFNSWTTPYVYCTSITYTASETSPAVSALPSFITFSSASRQFSVSSSSVTDAGTYTIKITGQLMTYGTATVSFQLVVTNPCLTMAITPSTVTTPQTYYINDVSKVISIPAFTSTVSTTLCGAFIYTIQMSIDGGSTYTSIDSSLFTFPSSSTPSLSVYTTTNSKAGTYKMKVTGQEGTYSQSIVTFDVVVVDKCYSTVITAPTFFDQTYYVSDTPLSFLFSAFTDSVATCGSFVYTSSLISPTVSSLPSFITFSSAGLSYSISTANIANAKSYVITLTGTLGVYGSKTVNINLVVLDRCATLLITPPTVSSPQVYYIRETQITLNIAAFTSNMSVASCGSLTYTVQQSIDSGSTYSTLDTSIYTLTQNGDLTFTLLIYTTSMAAVSNYFLKITEQQGVYSSQAQSAIFEVDIRDKCPSTVLSASAVADQTYYINDVELDFLFTQFTYSIGVCGSFTYAATITSPTVAALPSFVTFTSSTFTFAVVSSDISKCGNYVIKLTGTLGTYGSTSININLAVVDRCATLLLTAPTLASPQSYQVNDVALTNTISAFTSNMTVPQCGTLTYSILQSTDGGGTYQALDSSVFTLTTLGDGSFTFATQTTDTNKRDTYTLKLTAQQGAYSSQTKSLIFEIQILDHCVNAILSATSVPDQLYYVKDPALVFNFNAFTYNTGICGAYTYTASLTSPVIGSLPSYITLTSASLQFSVVSSDVAVCNTYLIKLTGTLGVYGLKSITITLNIIDPCLSLVITPPSFSSPYKYYIRESALTILMAVFTSSMTVAKCGSIVNTIQQSTDGGSTLTALDSTLFTYNENTQLNLVVGSTSSLSYLNTYTMVITSQQGIYSSLTQSITFVVQVLDKCQSTVITAPNQVDESYILSDPTFTFTAMSFTESVGYCGSFTYSAIISSPSSISLPSSFLSFNSATLQFDCSSSTISDAGIYQITLTGLLGIYGQKNKLIQLTIINPCLTLQLTPSVIISPQTYYITDPSYSISIPQFDTNVTTTLCGSIVCSAQQSKDNGVTLTSLNSLIFLFTSGSPSILDVQTNIASDAGLYLINVTCQEGIYNSASVIFEVDLIDLCLSTTISTTDVADQTYNLSDPLLPINFAAFTESIGYCGSFAYTATEVLPTMSSSLPSCLTFDATTHEISVFSSSLADSGTYQINITGTLGNYGSSSILVNIAIVNPCLTATITPPSVVNLDYYLTDPSSSEDIYDFTSSVSTVLCGSFANTFSQSSNGGTSYTILDTSLYTLIAGSPSTFSVSSSDVTKTGSYLIKVAGKQGVFQSASVTFTVNIINRCLTSSVTPSSLAQIIYYVSNPSLSATFNAFVAGVSYCGPFAYTAAVIDQSTGLPSALDSSLVSMNSATRTFSVSTNSPMKVGNYMIKVTGSLLGTPLSDSFLFSLNVQCIPFSVSHTPVANQTYTIQDKALTFSFPVFTQFPLCNYKFTYTANLISGQTLPSIIQFDSSTRTFTVYSSEISSANLYQIRVTGTLNDNLLTQDNTLVINLQVIPAVVPLVNFVPSFTLALENQVVIAGNSLTYSLPSYFDLNADLVTVTSKLGVAQTFVSFLANSFIITPPYSMATQTYLVQVRLQDSKGGFVVNTFSVNVIGHNSTTPTNSTPSIVLPSNSIKQNDNHPSISQILENNNTLSSEIISIAQNGILKIQFSDQIIVPLNISDINSTALNLTLLPCIDTDPEMLTFTWNTTNCSSRILTLQLEFEHPEYVSQLGV